LRQPVARQLAAATLVSGTVEGDESSFGARRPRGGSASYGLVEASHYRHLRLTKA
jgi:hypothetical protein